ncbi:hypothetical protein J4E91_008270 [Alternaria rosae]|nr:hypothetical protein J4E91_008270 [Alternaria rosae]
MGKPSLTNPAYTARYNEIADLFDAGKYYPTINKVKDFIVDKGKPMYHEMLSWVILALSLDHLDVIKICLQRADFL